MLKYNNNHLMTGYIKQLLASFNLPKYKVYTKENQEYFELHGTESPEIIETVTKGEGTTHTRYVSYIKDDKIQQYINENWKIISNTYSYNKAIPNHTKKLEIHNNVYDSYTHEYLGDYLRFMRDYNRLDLMSLYNCFSDKIGTDIDLTVKINNDTTTGEVITSDFKSNSTRDKIYILPVKLFKEYTIAIDCDTPVEMCCVIYGKYLDTREKFKSLDSATYYKVNSSKFNSPIIYDKLKELYDFIGPESKMELAQNENDLKLLIKLPINCQSSIVVLEGNYLGYSDSTFKRTASSWDKKNNHFITNYEGPIDETAQHTGFDENQPFKPISALQLLQVNTKESYAFSDRLIEYLLGQAITHMDANSDNIQRIQRIMAENRPENAPAMGFTGIWSDRIRRILYDFMSQDSNASRSDYNYDTLGYADRAIEKWYKSMHVITPADLDNFIYDPAKYKVGDLVVKNTLANVDIYEAQTATIERGGT